MRQRRILDWIERRAISRQEELARLLRRDGMPVTQSTLSRDIRELGLFKSRGRYRRPTQAVEPEQDLLKRSFRQSMIESGLSGNIVMIRTSPGNAHSIGVLIDAARWPEIMGTVAGDDTVFALLRDARLGGKVLRRLEGLLA